METNGTRELMRNMDKNHSSFCLKGLSNGINCWGPAKQDQTPRLNGNVIKNFHDFQHKTQKQCCQTGGI